MNIVLIIPTGVGAEIGGHAGDGNVVAKLFGGLSDILITHPNVVNASDINEMTENTLYVEGSILDRFLRGEIYLKEIKTLNRILLGVNKITPEIVNSVNAARVTIGAKIQLLEFKYPLILRAKNRNNRTTGDVLNFDECVEQVEEYYNGFDVLGLTTPIEVEGGVAKLYFQNGGLNPWGGVEAKVSKMFADRLDKPVAHSPIENPEMKEFNEIVDPRMAAEIVSISYLHCILKGLHKAPLINYQYGLSVDDVDILISPMMPKWEPHWACDKYGIPIIFVKENSTSITKELEVDTKDFLVDNYIEAAGLVAALKCGIDYRSVRRPIKSVEEIIND